MPFYSTSGPNYLPTQPTLSNVTIQPAETLSTNLLTGSVFRLSLAAVIRSDEITVDTETSINNIFNSQQSQQPTNEPMPEIKTTVNVINKNNNSVVDPIYIKILDVFQALSNQDNMKENNYNTTVIPLLDSLDAEIAQYPDITVTIQKIQAVFKRITGILTNLPPGTDSSYIEKYVLTQLASLDSLIANIAP